MLSSSLGIVHPQSGHFPHLSEILQFTLLCIWCIYSYRRDSSISVESINFRQFVRTLARFKRESKGHEHEMNTREKKLDCE